MIIVTSYAENPSYAEKILPYMIIVSPSYAEMVLPLNGIWSPVRSNLILSVSWTQSFRKLESQDVIKAIAIQIVRSKPTIIIIFVTHHMPK